uniref:Haloacid dehalogenase n=1 Tax=uncultured Alphaproteobacteria bacterium TaxID=91750 RepID=A0A6G8F2X9_9PROT|nr:haloacid dehalogenase [uncultured Alphaproteobacteria bacterium]
MKMIKPVVNISKIMDAHDVIVCGLNGVIYDGNKFKQEAIEALIRLRKNGKQIVLLSNTSMRLKELADAFYAAGISPKLFNNVVTMGEVVHYQLKSPNNRYAALGKIYYNLGDASDTGVFEGLGFQSTENAARADFLYAGKTCTIPGSSAEDSMELLSHSASLGIPMLCIGNDTSAFVDGEIRSASGAFAEQYAILGGKIVTVGKPDKTIVDYALETYKDVEPSRILMIGDSIPVDIKAANAAGISSALISKGIHVNFLGEGYIPDVTKTRELATTVGAYPDYVISSLRW